MKPMEKYIDITKHSSGVIARFLPPPAGSTDEERREWERQIEAHMLSPELTHEVHEHLKSLP